MTWDGFADGATNSIFSTATLLGGLPGNTGPNFRFDTSIPEPTTLALRALGLVGLGARRPQVR